MQDTAREQQIQQCRQRWALAPKSRAFAPLADALRQAGEYVEALDLLEKGLVLHPDFQAAMVILGLTLVADQQKDHGRKVLQTVLKMDPDNLVALDWLIEDACSRSAWEAAVPLLERMVKVEPDSPHWSQALATARQEFAPVTPKSTPRESFATMTLVDIYIAQGYHRRAREVLLRMQKQDPDRRDIADKLAELAAALAINTNAGDGDAAQSAGNKPGQRRDELATKRANEKKQFAEWLGRIEADESAAP